MLSAIFTLARVPAPASPPARDPAPASTMAASGTNVTAGGGGMPLPSSLDRLAALRSSLDLRAIS